MDRQTDTHTNTYTQARTDTTHLSASLMRVSLLGSEPGRGSHRGCPLTYRCWNRKSVLEQRVPGRGSCPAEHSVGSREEQVKAFVCQARDGVGLTGPEAPGRELRWPQTHPPMPRTPSSQPGCAPSSSPLGSKAGGARGGCSSIYRGPHRSRWGRPPCNGSVGTADGGAF